MLRLPLSFGRAPIDAAALGAALTPPPGPGLCCPMHAASMGAVAAAAAPFSRVRRLTRLLACSFFTSTSCALLGNLYRAEASRGTGFPAYASDFAEAPPPSARL